MQILPKQSFAIDALLRGNGTNLYNHLKQQLKFYLNCRQLPENQFSDLTTQTSTMVTQLKITMTNKLSQAQEN